MGWYKRAQEDHYEFYHGTDSPPFDTFNPEEATKGDRHYNPLGDAMYVTDKEDFARFFGKNVLPVRIPKGAKIKRIYPSVVQSALESIIKKALKQVGIDYWKGTSISFKVQLGKLFKYYSPYESMMEALALVQIEFPNIAETFPDAITFQANRKFSKFDVVMFMDTYDPNAIYIGSTPTKEILIFNKDMQRIFQSH